MNINEVNNKILNDNKFIIINSELNKIICEQNTQDNINNKIMYKMIPNFVEIYSINGNKFQFYNNKTNIIDKSAIVKKINTSKNVIKHIKTTTVDKIYLQIINFYENEKLIKSYLTDKQNIIIYKGFLIDKEWVDNWIKFSHYEIINKEFFQKDIFSAKEIKNYLKNEQINNNIINDLNKINDINNYINNYIIKDINKFEEELETNKSFVILNDKFLKLYVDNININPINFNLSYQSIKIKKPIGIGFLSFVTNDNILNNSKINIESNSQLFMHKSVMLNNSNNNLIKSNKNNQISNDIKENQISLKELKYYKEENEKLKNEINKLKDDNNKLNTELINANNTISSYQQKIKEIDKKSKDENNKLKEVNEKLKIEINKLKDDNNKLNIELNKAKNNISSYQNKIKEINNEINKLKNSIKEKDKEINDLKIKSGKYVDYDKIMVVNFISLDYDINCGINCLETETFAEVEEKLYKQYGQCRDTNNTFICGGSAVLRFKKIFKNNIKDGDKIILNIIQ